MKDLAFWIHKNLLLKCKYWWKKYIIVMLNCPSYVNMNEFCRIPQELNENYAL